MIQEILYSKLPSKVRYLLGFFQGRSIIIVNCDNKEQITNNLQKILKDLRNGDIKMQKIPIPNTQNVAIRKCVNE